MYRLTFVLIFILSLTGLSAQTDDNFGNNNNNNKAFSSGLGAADYSFDVGTQVGSAFHDSYWFTNYFSPNVRFDLSKKFTLKVGIGARYSQFNNFPLLDSEFNQSTFNGNFTSFYAYASGIYKLNSKVNLNATVMVEDALLNSPDMAGTINKQFKDVSFGMNYNITPHFSVNAQMQFSNRPFNNSFNGNSNFGINSPFGFSPFY